MIDLFGTTTSDAAFSPCTDCESGDRELCEDPVHRPWRYRLTRTWDSGRPTACFIMLNPSKAGRERDDPTIRRCIRFSQLWGYGGIVVLNLFALRATNPEELKGHEDPIGPDNDGQIRAAVAQCSLVVVAWGAHQMVSGRAAAVLGMMGELGVTLHCLGRTARGLPRHPLCVPYVPSEPYGVPAASHG